MKIVYNACYGGFGLSDIAYKRYAELAGIAIYPEDIGCGLTVYYLTEPTGNKKGDDSRESLYCRDFKRHDPILIQVVEELGEKANGQCAKLRIEETDSRMYRIDEYDGYESVATSYADDDWVIV